MSGYDLWNHPIGDLYEEMEAEGLIPECGDSEYYWPAMVLRANLCGVLFLDKSGRSESMFRAPFFSLPEFYATTAGGVAE